MKKKTPPSNKEIFLIELTIITSLGQEISEWKSSSNLPSQLLEGILRFDPQVQGGAVFVSFEDVEIEHPNLWFKSWYEKFPQLTEATISIKYSNKNNVNDFGSYTVEMLKDDGFYWIDNDKTISLTTKLDLHTVMIALEKIYETITHISEEMYAEISPRVINYLNLCRNNDSGRNRIGSILHALATALQVETVNAEQRGMASGDGASDIKRNRAKKRNRSSRK